MELLAVAATAGVALAIGYRMAPKPSCQSEMLALTRLGLEASSAKVVEQQGVDGTSGYAVHLSQARPHQLQLLRRLPNLQSLTVFGSSMTADKAELDVRLADLIRTSRPTRLHLLSLFEPLPVTYAALVSSSVQDLNLWMVEPKQLPELPPGLRELRLGGLPVDDANVATIARRPSLVRLTIIGAEFTPQDLASWGELTSLETLAILNAHPPDAISPESLRFVRQLSGLRTIAVDSPEIDDTFVETILSLPNVDNVALSGTAVTDEGVRRLLARRQLTGLALNGDSLTDAAFSEFGRQNRLTSLRLNASGLTNDTGRSIRHFVELTELDLSHTKIDALGLGEIFRLTKLKVVRLRGLELSSPLLEALAKLPELQSVEIIDSYGYSRAAVEAIAAGKSMKSLRLSKAVHIDDEFLDRVRAEHPALDLTAYQIRPTE